MIEAAIVVAVVFAPLCLLCALSWCETRALRRRGVQS